MAARKSTSPPTRRRSPKPAPKSRRTQHRHQESKPSEPASSGSSPFGDPKKGDGIDALKAKKLGYDEAEFFRQLLMPSPGASELGVPADVELSPEQEWVRAAGWTPLEYLVHAYRNPFVKHQDRIRAALGTLEYVHKRMPKPVELGSDPKNPLFPNTKAERMDLSKLTDAELEQFTALVQKMNVDATEEPQR